MGKYFITVRDIMRDTLYTFSYDSYTEFIKRYNWYHKDTDWEIISAHKVETIVNFKALHPNDLIWE